MIIVYDHQIFGWQAYGGISRYFFEIADGIARASSHHVAVVSPLYVNHYLRHHDPSLEVTGRFFPQIRRTGRIVRALNNVLAFPVQRSLKPDIVHETYYAPRRQAPRKAYTVVTVFDMIHEKFPDSFSGLDRTRHHKRAAIKRADHIVCISENTRQDLIELLGVQPERTSRIYLGHHLDRCGNLDTGDPIGRPYLLFVGLRQGYKNFSALVEAYAASERLRRDFSLVAFGGGAFTPDERRKIHRLGLAQDSVIQLSGSDTLLALLYDHALMFICPSKYEGFGIPPLEAMGCGCPVVCSNASSLPEVVGDAAELFDPEDVDAIRTAVETVAYSQTRLADLVARGTHRAREFSWSRCATETLAVYENLMA